VLKEKALKISIETIVHTDIQTVWTTWNTPSHIKQWNTASNDWHTTSSSVDLKEGGQFSNRMEAKDGSMGFDFSGTYTKIIPQSLIKYTLEDNRSITIEFDQIDDGVKVIETFEAENENDAEMQREGWQAILNNFAEYAAKQKISA